MSDKEKKRQRIYDLLNTETDTLKISEILFFLVFLKLRP